MLRETYKTHAMVLKRGSIGLSEFDSQPYFEKIKKHKIKTIIFWGDKDMGPESEQIILKNGLNAELFTFNAIGHYPHILRAKACALHMIYLIDSVENQNSIKQEI